MFRRLILISTLTLLGAETALAQAAIRDPNQPEKPPSFTFTITPRIFNGIMSRAAEDTARRYGFDEDQQYLTRQLFQERIPRWFAENQERIQPLLTTYMEEFLADEPPTPEDVAKWASDVSPLLEEFRTVLVDVSDDMGAYMTEDQLIQKEGELAALNVAFGFAQQRMENWAAGGFDPVIDHPTGESFDTAERERQQALREISEDVRRETVNEIYASQGREVPFPNRARRPAADRAADGQPPTASGKPKDPWELEVDAFIKKYDLNEDQQTQAYKILRSLQQQRDNYLRRKSDDLDALEAQMKLFENEPEKLEKVITQYEAAAEPLARMKRQLNDRLNNIPTRAQRRAARDAETSASAGS